MSEAAEQMEIVAWFRAEYPEYARCLRVSLAGLNFGSGAKAGRMAAWVRSQGITAGESDIAVLLKRGEFGSLLIEHKAGDGNHKTSDAQLGYIQFHNAVGNCAVVTKGVDMAKAAIRQYMGVNHG